MKTSPILWVQWRIQGSGLVGPGPPLIFRPNGGSKGRKKHFLWPAPRLISGSGWPPRPTPIWRFGSATGLHIESLLSQQKQWDEMVGHFIGVCMKGRKDDVYHSQTVFRFSIRADVTFITRTRRRLEKGEMIKWCTIFRLPVPNAGNKVHQNFRIEFTEECSTIWFFADNYRIFGLIVSTVGLIWAILCSGSTETTIWRTP